MGKTSIAFFVSELNRAGASNMTSFNILMSKNVYDLAFLLYNMGLIRGMTAFIKAGSMFLKIFLKYKKEAVPVYKKIQIIDKPKYNMKMSLKKLIAFKSGDNNNNLFVLTTNKGLFIDTEAIYWGYGGKPVIVIVLF